MPFENLPEPLPRLYALHRDDDEDGPPTVVAWGLAFADGSAVTLWADPYPGAAIAACGPSRISTPTTPTPISSG